MVGHFLHPKGDGKRRSSSSNRSNVGHQHQHIHHSQSTAHDPLNDTHVNNSSSSAHNNIASNSVHGSVGSHHGSDGTSSRRSAPAVTSETITIPPSDLTAEAVAALPPPGLSGPSALVFSPQRNGTDSSSSSGQYLAFVSCLPSNPVTASVSGNSRRLSSRSSPSGGGSSGGGSGERQLCVLDLQNVQLSYQQQSSSQPQNITIQPLLKLPPPKREEDSLEERLRKERQRMHYTSGGAVTQFAWSHMACGTLRLLVPIRGNIYIQDGVGAHPSNHLQLVYDKHVSPIERRNTHAGSVVGRDASAIDPQLSPDGTMVAFVVAGDIYVVPILLGTDDQPKGSVVRLTYGAEESPDCAVTHGLADFVAQEEMDRYRGYWWDPSSRGILFTRVDETHVPPYRITHQGKDGAMNTNVAIPGTWVTATSDSDGPVYEDHRYPFAGQDNPKVKLGYVRVHRDSMFQDDSSSDNIMNEDGETIAQENWTNATWFAPPREATEYLARINWLPDGSACAQWQNRTQSTLVLVRLNIETGKTRTLLTERSDVWINLHHMMKVLPRAVHPDECDVLADKTIPPVPSPLPVGSFSFLFASERTGYCHLYLYTFAPGYHGDQAMCLRVLSGGEWVVESICGVDMEKDVVYVTGTYDSPLERHLYALPIVNVAYQEMISSIDVNMIDASDPHPQNGVRRGFKSVISALSGAAKPSSFRSRSTSSNMSISTEVVTEIPTPLRLTAEQGMHSISMDDDCRMFVDVSSDLVRPTSVNVYELPLENPFSKTRSRREGMSTVEVARWMFSLHDAADNDKSRSSVLGSMEMSSSTNRWNNLPPPELLTFPTADGTETLHAAVYRPDPRIHGPGPYPLICAVYGGPHVQRVNRSWSQCADMRAQRLRSMGFAVVKCDNRGSSRRGLAFESAIRHRLGRLEVLDQVTTVRQLILRGIADGNRVGIYGWSYGGYLSAMCLCRAPDVFHVAVAGAPVTSWDGYDTHYTERYMGLPSENLGGYRESAVFDHVPHMRGKLMIVHGLIDENVHFRHTARLINRLIAAGKDYDLLIFPDERHSPRRLRDRIYMEQRISDYFLRHLGGTHVDGVAYVPHQHTNNNGGPTSAMRTMAGHL